MNHISGNQDGVARLKCSKQRGFTFTSFLIVLIIVGFFAFIGMKIGPAYLEFNNVKTSMANMVNDPEMKGKSPAAIRDSLVKRFDISYVDSVKPAHMKFARDPEGILVTVDYEVRKPLFYNLDYVAKFNHSVVVPK